MIEMNIKIRKVKFLNDEAKEEAKKKGFKPDDLVIVRTKIIDVEVIVRTEIIDVEKIEGDPISYLLKHSH